MSGRRLLSCFTCRQKHYAPSGARCPFQPGETLPAHVLPPTTQADANQGPTDDQLGLDDVSSLFSDEHNNSLETLADSECDIPSAQPQNTGKDDPQQQTPITLQQFADSTTGRVDQLELEKRRLEEAHAALLTQQQNLQASFDTLRQQFTQQQLVPNKDVRAKQTRNTTAPKNRPDQAHYAQDATSPLAGPSNRQPTTPVQSQPQMAAFAAPLPDIQGPTTQHHPPTAANHHAPNQPIPLNPPPFRPILQGNATLADLRTDARLMSNAARVVAENVQEQQDNGKNPKSGLKRDNTEQVCRLIPWPHEYVLRYTGKPPTYDSLSLAEFAAGYMRILASTPGAPEQIVHMATHLSELFDDTADTEWSAARFAHKSILQAVENGYLDFSATMEIRQMRAMAINRATRRSQIQNSAPQQPQSRFRQNTPSSQNNSAPKRICQPYQKGECSHPRAHTSPNGYVLHACAYCFNTVGRTYNHPESECRRKSQTPAKDTKNDETTSDR